MQVLMLVLHIMLVILNTVLSVMNFKNGERLLETLWAITVPFMWLKYSNSYAVAE